MLTGVVRAPTWELISTFSAFPSLSCIGSSWFLDLGHCWPQKPRNLESIKEPMNLSVLGLKPNGNIIFWGMPDGSSSTFHIFFLMHSPHKRI